MSECASNEDILEVSPPSTHNSTESEDDTERQIHHENMFTLDRPCFTEYSTDIIQSLQMKERDRISFSYQSPQVCDRYCLVKLMASISEKKRISTSAVHLGVYILDIFMDNHSIARERLSLVAMVCLLLGSKYEDKDSNTPKNSDLNKFINNQYPINDFVSLEIMILQFLRWNLHLPTAANFVEYFCFIVVSKTDYLDYCESRSHYKDCLDSRSFDFFLKESIRIAFGFLDCILDDITLTQTTPSLVAAACIGATRQTVKLTRIWPTSLQIITSYALLDIQLCINRLIGLRSKRCGKRKRSSLHDSGYMSENITYESSPKKRALFHDGRE